MCSSRVRVFDCIEVKYVFIYGNCICFVCRISHNLVKTTIMKLISTVSDLLEQALLNISLYVSMSPLCDTRKG